MKKRVLSFFAAAGLMLVLTFPVAAPAAPPAGGNATLAGNPVPREPHPEIREAIASLRRARAHMEHAAHDFGGHRVAAIKACDEAIQQLQEALKYDKE